ncbi:MAG: PIG-L deacetylase family protein [Anaerolineaceae bacterium]
MTEPVDKWPQGAKILVILAHPDDPEFFLGGTIASWTQSGYEVQYALLTKGERGISAAFPDCAQLLEVRMVEQRAAADVLGVTRVDFFDYPDGYLVPDLDVRREVTKLIRKVKPDIVVSCDPQNYYLSDTSLNHPDHRAAGQIVVDAVFPAVGNRSFFPELAEEGFPVTMISELWLSLPFAPTVEMDVSDCWGRRIEALLQHHSQIGDPDAFKKHLEDHRAKSNGSGGRYIERFRRIVFRRQDESF